MAKPLKMSPIAIDPGQLRHQISIQSPSTSQTSTGSPTTSWTTFHTCMAAINTVSSREVYQASQFTAQVSHAIKMRWPGPSVAIQGGQQVLFGSRVFKLQAVENVQERNRILILHCLEINGVQ